MAEKLNTHYYNIKRKIQNQHLKYKSKGLYKFIGLNILKIVLVYTFLIILLILIGKYLLDFGPIFQFSINNFSDKLVLIIFFISESFLGLVPVDLFMIWTTKFKHPISYLFLLGVLSYVGGIISYQIGYWISKRKKIKAYTEKMLQKYILFIQKWGGAFIIIAALFPFSPFSLVTIAVSVFRYPFKKFLIYGTSRLIRFVVQGVIFFDLLDLDTWVV